MRGRRLNRPILQRRQLHQMQLPGDQNAEVELGRRKESRLTYRAIAHLWKG